MGAYRSTISISNGSIRPAWTTSGFANISYSARRRSRTPRPTQGARVDFLSLHSDQLRWGRSSHHRVWIDRGSLRTVAGRARRPPRVGPKPDRFIGLPDQHLVGGGSANAGQVRRVHQKYCRALAGVDFRQGSLHRAATAIRKRRASTSMELPANSCRPSVRLHLLIRFPHLAFRNTERLGGRLRGAIPRAIPHLR
jgi:hypothetical protein